MPLLNCDFCHKEGHEFHRLKTKTFRIYKEDLHFIYESYGDWAACDTCYTLVVNKNWKELVDRTMDSFELGQAPKSIVERLRQQCEILHAKFRENYTCEPLC